MKIKITYLSTESAVNSYDSYSHLNPKLRNKRVTIRIDEPAIVQDIIRPLIDNINSKDRTIKLIKIK